MHRILFCGEITNFKYRLAWPYMTASMPPHDGPHLAKGKSATYKLLKDKTPNCEHFFELNQPQLAMNFDGNKYLEVCLNGSEHHFDVVD